MTRPSKKDRGRKKSKSPSPGSVRRRHRLPRSTGHRLFDAVTLMIAYARTLDRPEAAISQEADDVLPASTADSPAAGVCERRRGGCVDESSVASAADGDGGETRGGNDDIQALGVPADSVSRRKHLRYGVLWRGVTTHRRYFLGTRGEADGAHLRPDLPSRSQVSDHARSPRSLPHHGTDMSTMGVHGVQDERRLRFSRLLKEKFIKMDVKALTEAAKRGKERSLVSNLPYFIRPYPRGFARAALPNRAEFRRSTVVIRSRDPLKTTGTLSGRPAAAATGGADHPPSMILPQPSSWNARGEAQERSEPDDTSRASTMDVRGEPGGSSDDLNGGTTRSGSMTSSMHREREDEQDGMEDGLSMGTLSRTMASVSGCKAKRVRFYRNGDQCFKGFWYGLRADRLRSLQQLMDMLTRCLATNSLALQHGVRNIYTIDGAARITDLEQFENGESYVCASSEVFKEVDYVNAREPLWSMAVPNTNYSTLVAPSTVAASTTPPTSDHTRPESTVVIPESGTTV